MKFTNCFAGTIGSAPIAPLPNSSTADWPPLANDDNVGQPAGDYLQFRAEGFLIKLPATGITAYVSTARHDFRHLIGWFSDCYFLDKIYGVAVDSITPRIGRSKYQSIIPDGTRRHRGKHLHSDQIEVKSRTDVRIDRADMTIHILDKFLGRRSCGR